MKFADVKDLSKTELVKKNKAAVAELFTLKMKNTLGQLANPLEIRKVRREVARIKTALSLQSQKVATKAAPKKKTAKK
jgi:large subunit ribosomal protein L29